MSSAALQVSLYCAFREPKRSIKGSVEQHDLRICVEYGRPRGENDDVRITVEHLERRRQLTSASWPFLYSMILALFDQNHIVPYVPTRHSNIFHR